MLLDRRLVLGNTSLLAHLLQRSARLGKLQKRLQERVHALPSKRIVGLGEFGEKIKKPSVQDKVSLLYSH